MRALVCTALTGIGALAVEERPEPSPLRGEVLVTVAAAGLNYPDLLMTTGSYQHKPEPPFVPGMEGAGTIVAVGDGVDPALLGTRVMFAGRGTFATHVAVAVGEVGRIPAAWSFEEAAGFPVAAKTAFHALVHRAALKAGETLVVHGASGGVGHLAVKLGKALGAHVIATTGAPSKAAFLRACGADQVVDARATDLADQLKAASQGRGVDVVFDAVGGAVFEASLKAARFGARVLVVGFTAAQPNTVRTNYALIKGLAILGVRAGEAARQDPQIAASYRTELPRLADAFELKPHVSATWPLADARDAFAALERRDVTGKIILVP